MNARKLCTGDLELLFVANNLVRFCFLLASYTCFSCLISPASLNLWLCVGKRSQSILRMSLGSRYHRCNTIAYPDPVRWLAKADRWFHLGGHWHSLYALYRSDVTGRAGLIARTRAKFLARDCIAFRHLFHWLQLLSYCVDTFWSSASFLLPGPLGSRCLLNLSADRRCINNSGR